MISIFSSRMPIKFPGLPLSLSHVGRLLRLLLQEQASVARQ